MSSKDDKGIDWEKYLPFALLIPIVGCFAAIQMGTDRFAGNDGYFHIKHAWLLWHEGAVWDFPWLKGTFFEEKFTDPAFLFHVLLIPFTLHGDLYLAGKSAPVFFASIAIFTVHWVIRSFGTPGSVWQKHSWFAVLVLMAASQSSLYRLSMPRVPAASLTFMMLGILALERRSLKWLGIIGFLYAWMYQVSISLIPLALFYSLAHWYDEDKWDLRPVLVAAGSVAAGFIFNPYFPTTIPIFFNHVVEIGIGTSDIPKGAEWAAYDSWYMFTTAKVAWTALFLGGLSLFGTPARGRHLALLAATAMMMFAYFKSRRFVEYWPYFAILFSASVFYDALKSEGSLVNRVRRALRPTGESALVIVTIAVLVGIGVRNIRDTVKEVAANALPTRLEGATTWLKENTPEGTQVYNVEWDIFPELLFYNHQNHWTLGLDPNFTYKVDPRLYYASVAIGGGTTTEPGYLVQEFFNARYAIATNKSALVRRRFNKHSGLKEVFKDEHASVFKIVPSAEVRTLEGELHTYTSDLDKKNTRCRFHTETSKDTGGSPRTYQQCWLREATPFTLKYNLEFPQSGAYTVGGRFLTGASKGTVDFLVDGKPLTTSIPLSAEKRELKQWKSLGKHYFPAGKKTIEVRFAPQLPDEDKRPKAASGKPSKWPIELGFDALRFVRDS